MSLLTLLSPKPTMWVKIAGVWKPTRPYIKVAGVWKTVAPKIKISGTWK